MAKKKGTKRAAKKAAPKKAAPKAKAAKKARPRTTSPRSQVLPGMEQVRNKALDRVCEGISDVRGDLNRLRGEEQDLQRQAVKTMQADKVTAYRSAGVELVLVPGDVKLRVHTLKAQNADAPAEEDAGVTADDVADAEDQGDQDEIDAEEQYEADKAEA